MTLLLGILAGALALGAGLAWRLRTLSRENRRIRSRLEDATTDLEQLQHTFSRFAPSALVDRIIADGLPTAGDRREVTVLFCDLVGFTELAERLEPDVLIEVLNGYFERMSRAIVDHRGHVATFIGDGILALFGALEPNPWQGDDAVHAALAMRAELEAYNRELRAGGLPELALGVGLHRGTGIAALVGSKDRREFTIVGRTINVAARLQDLTRSQDADVLLTGELRDTLDPRFEVRGLSDVQLRGISDPVAVFSAVRFDGD